jgi:hypothetical protein
MENNNLYPQTKKVDGLLMYILCEKSIFYVKI